MSGPWPGYRGPQLFILLLATMYTVLCASASMQYQELDQDNRPWYWTDCTPPGDHRIIGNFRVQPVPLKLGQKWSANLSFTLKKEITGGTINFTAEWSPNEKIPPVVLVTEPLRLCDFVEKISLNCPIPSGHYSRIFANSISPILPKGFYTFSFTAEDQNGNVVACVKGRIMLSS